jgi:hypothetical protein
LAKREDLLAELPNEGGAFVYRNAFPVKFVVLVDALSVVFSVDGNLVVRTLSTAIFRAVSHPSNVAWLHFCCACGTARWPEKPLIPNATAGALGVTSGPTRPVLRYGVRR